MKEIMKNNFDKFCKNNKNGDRNAAKLFFKIVEAYLLTEKYKVNDDQILSKNDEHLQWTFGVNICKLIFKMWDQIFHVTHQEFLDN